MICVGTGEEQVRKVSAGVTSKYGETSRLGSRDSMADRIQSRLHGGKKSKTKSCTVPWLSFKAKTESIPPWWPSHACDWRGGRTKFAGFAVVHRKTTRFLSRATKRRPNTEARTTTTLGRSDWWGATVQPVCVVGFRRLQSGGHTT
jgi:hypothetical protein